MKPKYMTQSGVIIILFFVITSLSGCTYYAYKDIQVLTPPATPILSKGKKLTILENSHRVVKDSAKMVLLDTIHRYALEGFLYSLVDYGNIPFDVDSSTIINISQDKKISYSDWKKLDSLSKIRGADVVIVLDASDATSRSDFFFNDLGYVEAWKDFYIANRWVLLDPLTQRVIQEEIIIDTLTYTEYGFFVNATQEKLPVLEDAIAELSWETGRMYAAKYIPTWQNSSRLYYELPKDGYKKAINALKSDNLDLAAEVFQIYANNRNSRISALSKYNMAVVCELKGEYELALKWLEDSYKTKPYITTDEYVKVIKRRINDKERLQ